MSESDWNATVTGLEQVTGRLRVVRVTPDAEAFPAFEPGQYIWLGTSGADGKAVRRPFSIASSPQGHDTLEFLMAAGDDGWPAGHPGTLAVGARLRVADPAGVMTLAGVPTEADLVMVSTGSGIAAFLSMLRCYRGKERWRRIVMIHGARRPAELWGREELEAVCREDEAVQYIPVVSREPADSDWAGQRGRVQGVLEPAEYERLTGARLDAGRCHVFLCGHREMVQSVRETLEERGFRAETAEERGNIHFERY